MTDLRKAAEKLLQILDGNPESFDAWIYNPIRSAREELRQALAQPEQEPVLAGSLSVRYFRGDKAMTDTYFEYLGDLSEGDYTLHAAPPKREPLMTKYVIDLWDEYGLDPIKFAREIEAAHGIRSKHEHTT